MSPPRILHRCVTETVAALGPLVLDVPFGDGAEKVTCVHADEDAFFTFHPFGAAAFAVIAFAFRSRPNGPLMGVYSSFSEEQLLEVAEAARTMAASIRAARAPH